ncbi:unnamed protein product [Linum tenue]|uniref:Uncharacterized protein n=1 Tax=Linum tenue TaxID=586396 RepID=A0AAV0S8P9_9ROSI|nr:unnamed protein product [Linum tenue]
MAAAASGSNGNGNKYFHLNVVAIVTTATGPNGGAPVTREAERVFTLPLEPMLNEDSATPYVRKIVESFLPMKIPDPEDNVAIVDKVADVALRLFVALEGDEIDNKNNNKTSAGGGSGSGSGSAGAASLGLERRWFYAKDGLPMTKVTIYVAHDGFVSVVGDFESDDDEDDTDSDDEDGDEEEEGVEAMEKK